MTPRQTVSDIGERELIHLLSQWAVSGSQPDGSFGIGDDCAEIPAAVNGDADKCGRTILTTDLLIEGTHFLRSDQTDWHLVGFKAAAANISDLAAAGSQPRALLVSIGAPPDFPVDALENLYRGLSACAQQDEAPIMGGDTTRADRLTISITAIGWKAPGMAALLRSDARAGDTVYLTGNLGASRAGLELLLKPELKKLISEPAATCLVRRHFMPPSRINAGLCLAKIAPRTAVIDISDGLFNEAKLIAEASAVQLTLNLDAIPVDKDALEFCAATSRAPEQFALFSGEEYELLFTSPVSLQNLCDQFTANGVNCHLSAVGTVNPGSGVVLLQGGHPVDPSDETYVHFN